MDLTIIRETEPSGAVRLRLSGAIDLASKDGLLETAKSALAAAPQLLLNLSDVRFMDSTGISVLIDLAHEAEDHGKSFAVEEPSSRVQRILAVTGLQDAWTLPSTAQDG
ncbi:MAG TPA: STAS domain-containing protein [Jatrophihabitans sp.]|nr:STAS domain-containing protein [Jatrophihabitans sp.]